MNNLYILDKTINALAKGLILLLPLFFLPWSIIRPGIDNFGKLQLLLFIVPLLIILRLFKAYKNQELSIRPMPLLRPAGIFLLVYFLSSLFSLDSFSSFFGAFPDTGAPFLAWLVLFLFYFFLLQHLGGREKTIPFLMMFFYGYAFIILSGLFVALGMAGDWLPAKNSANVFLNITAGDLYPMAIYIVAGFLALFNVVADAEAGQAIFRHKSLRLFFIIILFIAVILLLLIGFRLAWLLIVFGLLAGLGLKFVKKQKIKSVIAGHKLYFILAAFFIFIAVSAAINSDGYFNVRPGAQNPLQLNYVNTADIALSAAAARPVLGYGPETFGYLFSLFRSESFNAQEYWHYRFNQGSAHIFEIAAYGGISGLLAYLFFLASIAYLVYKYIKYRVKTDAMNGGTAGSDDFDYGFLPVPAILAMMLGQLFYSSNLLLLFVWLFLLAVFARRYTGLAKPEKTLKITGVRAQQISGLLLAALLIGSAIFWTGGVKQVLARAYYKLGQSDSAYYGRAAGLNPHQYNYHTAAAKVYLNRALEKLNSGKFEVKELENTINQSIQSAQNAVRANPNSVAAHETLGTVYKSLNSYIDNNDLAIEAFAKAALLEPSNPVIFTQLGIAYMQANDFENALSAFNRALKLKPAFYEAAYNLALVFEKQGKYAPALDILNDLEAYYNNTDIYFLQGKLHFNREEYEAASAEFQKVIASNPDHANALYSLGAALEKQGQAAEALSYFKKAYALNPENQDLQEKINKLEEELKK